MDIDSALDVLGASGAGHKEKKLDRHPERRMKSAYAAFAEKETKRIKEENPHLRQSQIKNRIYKLVRWRGAIIEPAFRLLSVSRKTCHALTRAAFPVLDQWKKSPENPMNQEHLGA